MIRPVFLTPPTPFLVSVGRRDRHVQANNVLPHSYYQRLHVRESLHYSGCPSHYPNAPNHL